MTAVTNREFSIPADPPGRESIARVAARQRSRDELEVLADKFVHGNAPEAVIEPARWPTAWIAGAVGLFIVVSGVLIGLWLNGGDDAARSTQAPATEGKPALADDWSAKLEAERQKQRVQMERSRQYLEKLAAAEAAAQVDFQQRAAALVGTSTPESRPADEPKPIEQAAAAAPAPFAQAQAPLVAAAKPAESKAQPAETANPTANPAPPAATPAPQPAQTIASAHTCKMHVSELSSSGTLTYEAVARIKGARVDQGSGIVTLPPVDVPGRGAMIFTVKPDGCVRYRSAGGFGR